MNSRWVNLDADKGHIWNPDYICIMDKIFYPLPGELSGCEIESSGTTQANHDILSLSFIGILSVLVSSQQNNTTKCHEAQLLQHVISVINCIQTLAYAFARISTFTKKGGTQRCHLFIKTKRP